MLRLCYHWWLICFFPCFRTQGKILFLLPKITFSILYQNILSSNCSLPATKWFVQERSQELIYSYCFSWIQETFLPSLPAVCFRNNRESSAAPENLQTRRTSSELTRLPSPAPSMHGTAMFPKAYLARSYRRSA